MGAQSVKKSGPRILSICYVFNSYDGSKYRDHSAISLKMKCAKLIARH